MSERKRHILFLLILTPATLAFHSYSHILDSVQGQTNFMHHVMADLCYIPIILAAIWFGLRGAIATSTVIAIFAFIFSQFNPPPDPGELLSDYVEIIFFYLVGAVSGIVLDKDRRLRRILDETRRNLYQAERLSIIGQMAASIVHDIKSPLAAIVGAAKILKDKSITEKQRDEYTEVIETEAHYLDDVVHNLLVYPHPNAPILKQINIAKLLDAMVHQHHFQAKIQGIQIGINCCDPLPVQADNDKLTQALSNIVVNAMQAMPNGGKIDIECCVINNQSGKSLKIEISDDGPGIPKDELAKIFKPFYTTKSQGTGLGLSISNTIIKTHGGRINVESIEGKGTKFIIVMPQIDDNS